MPETLRVIDSFFSEYLGCDQSRVLPGQTVAVASRRRERREATFGTIFALWALIKRESCVVSTQPGLVARVARFLENRAARDLQRPGVGHELADLVTRELGQGDGYSLVSGPLFACSHDGFRRCDLHPCRQIEPEDMLELRVLGLDAGGLERSMGEGTCYAALFRERPVAISGTHAIGHMADQVGDICVETLKSFRQQGYGKTAVSQVTAVLLARGLVPLYATSDWNEASARTARSLGFEPYGWQLRIQIPDRGAE